MRNPWRVCLPLHRPDDPLEPLPAPAPAPAPAIVEPRESHVTCEFCECVLTRHGHALRLSNRAREYRDQEERLETLKRELDAATRTIADLKRAAAESETPKRASLFK